MGARLAFIVCIVLLAYAFLVFHLYQLQIEHGGTYLAKADSQYSNSATLQAKRGFIYFTDRNGGHTPVALDKDFPVIYADPKAIDDPTEEAARLSPLLGIPTADLEKKLSKKGDTYESLLKKADQGVADKVSDLHLKGVFVNTAPFRYYPLGSLAAQLIGFVGPNSTDNGESGRYGIEAFYDAALAGRPGQIANQKVISATPGSDVTLTIDSSIQLQAEQTLQKLVQTYKADGGSVIVEDPQTGKILAMGSNPTFDLNVYNETKISSFLNTLVQQIYEPGSVFKVLTMSAGIDSGKITPETTYKDTGELTLNGRTIRNFDFTKHGPYGVITMTNVIEHSLNVGAAFAEKTTGNEIFTSYLKKFGLNEKTGVGLPGEVKGDLRQLNPKARQIAFATASYGQGVAVTPIELITAVSAIANGGNLLRPYVDESLKPEVIRRVISAETARKVTKMMVSAVDKAQIAKIDGYTIAGKTGTAFIPDFTHGGYTDNVINTYVGFAPSNNAKFIILLKLDNPAGAPVAGLSVVPAFRDLAQFILNYYNIPPDRLP